MSLRIPQSGRWTGPYLGNYIGDLWKTFNIDLDREEGKIGLSNRLDTVADSTDTNSDTMGVISAFVRTNSDCTDRYWALSDSGNLYKVDSSPTGDWQVDVLDSSPTRCHDFTIFERDTRGDSLSRQQLFVTTDCDIAVLNDTGSPVWNGSWWTGSAGGNHAGDSALDTGVRHPIEYFPFQRIVLVGSGNRIHTIQRTSATVNETTNVSRLTLPSDLRVIHIFTTTNRAWMLCANTKGGDGKIVEWDGYTQTFNNIHNVLSTAPISGVNYNDIPIVLNNKGVFLEYSGNSFVPMYRNGQQVALPIANENFNGFTLNGTSLLSGIAPRGMMVGEDGLIYINLVQPTNHSPKQGAGIWCLNPMTGRLYNKYSIGQWSFGNTDFGQQRIPQAGALYSIPVATGTARPFLVGGQVYTGFDTPVRNAIWAVSTYDNTTATRGYFVTQFIQSSEIKDFWDSLWVRFKQFITSTDRIVVKARGVRSLYGTPRYLPLESTITWVNATSFTVQLNANDDALAIGDEVEIISGDNAGTLSHITTISGNHAAVQTITIDETLTASTNNARARFDRWKKLGSISSTSVYEFPLNIGISSSFIQFKIELRGPSAELEISDLIINNEKSIIKKK